MARYESEHTRYMREWLEKHPEEREVRRSGRALWWDRLPRSPDDLRRTKESCVPQKPYCYDMND